MPEYPITPLYAIILGIVEGLTEFLPVSSTGHLILTAHWLGLSHDDAGVKAFEIVIQAGALLAVIELYRRHIQAMLKGLVGRDPDGRRLLIQLFVAFLPAVVVGLLAGDWIKARLFGPWPVISALFVGGAVMVAIERWRGARHGGDLTRGRPLADMTWRLALIIGCVQCLAMWPGTSRSMVTIVGALVLGFNPRASAEFSFLLALPTLGAATAYDLIKEGAALLDASGWLGLALGFSVSFAVAWLAIKGFLTYLTRHGMAIFGWYRIVLAIIVALAIGL